MESVMEAAVLRGPGDIDVQEVPMPHPSPSQVVFRVEASGVCGSNVAPWEGRPWFTYPLDPGAPGHEGWGRVVDVGSEVRGLAPGDRIAALSYRAFAEHDVAEASEVVRLPAALDAVPFPGEAIACAVNVIRRSALADGQNVAIVGIGFLGALLVQLARLAGARVVALARRPFALGIAEQCGAAATVPLDDGHDPIRRSRDAIGGRDFECVIEATGAQAPLDLAAQLTAERGRLVIAGYHQDGRRQVDMQLWNWRGIDVINAHERQASEYVKGLRAAVTLVASGRLDLRPLVTHHFPLREAARAFDLAVKRPDGFLKAVVHCDAR